MKHFIVNLARRKDRRAFMEAKLADAGVTDYEFVEAVDQRVLDKNKTTRRWIYKGIRVGRAGPAIYMSFLKTCRLALDQGHTQIAYLEDDVYFHKDYVARFNHYVDTGVMDHDLVYLGYCTGKLPPHMVTARDSGQVVTNPKLMPGFFWGAYGLVMNAKVMQMMLDRFPLTPTSRAIDIMLLYRLQCRAITAALLHPVLVVPEFRDVDNMHRRPMTPERMCKMRGWKVEDYRMFDKFGEFVKV